MKKNTAYLSVFIILLLAILAGILDYPRYFDQGIDFLNSKMNMNLSHYMAKPFKLGLDLQGGTHLVYEADLSSIESDERETAMQGLRDVIERRVNLFGVQEPIVQTQEAEGNHRLIVELAGIKDVADAIEMIGQTPFLEFKKPLPKEESDRIISEALGEEAADIPSETACQNFEFLAYFIHEHQQDPCFQPTELTGKYLAKATVATDQIAYQPLVLLQFDDEGGKLFEELTAEHVGRTIAIYIDGMPISLPTVQEPISGGSAQITGSFTIDGARALARNLNAGALPVPINLIFQQTVGPTLGAVSLQDSLKAGIIGLIAICLFMIFFYRFPGLLASITLLIYVVFIMALFKLMSVTLTLAGIGGFLLSIGMAIDANVLIFSRMREELEAGNSLSASIEEGFRRAWPSIRDGNITTLIIGFILFNFGTSFIKGFALTLSLGILLSMFSAIFITKNILRCFIGTGWEKHKWLWG